VPLAKQMSIQFNDTFYAIAMVSDGWMLSGTTTMMAGKVDCSVTVRGTNIT